MDKVASCQVLASDATYLREINYHLSLLFIAVVNDCQFLSRISTLTRDIDIANLSVRPFVCPSVRNV